MSNKNLDEIINEDEESLYDNKLSDIFQLSANIKSKSRLIRQEFGINDYYVCMADKNIVKDIRSLEDFLLEALYFALKRPLVLIYNEEAFCLRQKFDGLEASYFFDPVKASKKELTKLEELYKKGEIPDVNDDRKFSEMYRISSEIKEKSFNVYLEDEGFSFYITDTSALGKNAEKILNYISNLNKTDLERFSNITSLFSIIDTEKKKRYAILSYNEGNAPRIKFSGTADSEEEYAGLNKILEIAKESGQKFLSISKNTNNYSPKDDAPSDMYQ
ncbi:MAG: hypothetical protein ACP5MV_01675 [Candidatus Parvarchaeum sp.]